MFARIIALVCLVFLMGCAQYAEVGAHAGPLGFHARGLPGAGQQQPVPMVAGQPGIGAQPNSGPSQAEMLAAFRGETVRLFPEATQNPNAEFQIAPQVGTPPRPGCILVDTRQSEAGTAQHWRCPKIPGG